MRSRRGLRSRQAAIAAAPDSMMPCYHSLRVSIYLVGFIDRSPPREGFAQGWSMPTGRRTTGLGAEDTEASDRRRRPALYDPGIEPDGPPRKYDLLRRAAKEVIPRPALGQEVEKRIGRADSDAAQNIGAAGEKGVGPHPDGRPDNGDAGLGPGERQQILKR